MKIKVLNKEVVLKEGTTLEDLAKELNITNAIAATVDGRLRELTFKLTKDHSAVEFLDLSNTDAVR
ncbi:MAG: hypothetical protein GX312_00980, partial [Candidatus Phytoplasma sp.]|nr:hypothetical protein [Phytoplasma sp.]